MNRLQGFLRLSKYIAEVAVSAIVFLAIAVTAIYVFSAQAIGRRCNERRDITRIKGKIAIAKAEPPAEAFRYQGPVYELERILFRSKFIH
jgi:hypothetical protein